MWDFTTVGQMANLATFGYRDLIGGVTEYTFGMQYRIVFENLPGVVRLIFSQANSRVIDSKGFELKTVDDKLYISHDGNDSVVSPAIALNTTYGFLLVWTSTAGLIIYRDGVLWHTDAAFLAGVTVPWNIHTAIGSSLAGDPAKKTPKCMVGNIAIWPSLEMNATDAVMWHNGIMPHRGSVRFFHKCVELPGKDEYTRQIPDCYRFNISDNLQQFLPYMFQDQMQLYSDPSDFYYPLHGETIHSEMQILAGEELHRRRLVKKSYQITVPVEFLTEDLGEDLQVTHKGGLECTGEGFGYGDAPERLVRIEGMALDPGDRTIGLTLRDIKRHAVSYYNSFRAPYTITGRQLGVFQLIPTYAAKETIRPSYSWGQDLQGIYQEFGFDQEPLTGKGLLVESRKRNYVANSAFKHQLTSWNTTDPGTGTITAEIPDVLALDNSITGYAIKMVCGTPFAGNWVRLHQVVAGAGVAKDMTLSFIYYAPTAGNIQLQITRASDGWFLQSLTGPFAAPNVTVVPPLETSYKEPYRYVMPYVFDGNDVYTIYFYCDSVDGKVLWLYHVQFEEGLFATGPVVNETDNAYVRQGSVVQLRNPDGLLLPKEHGTVAFEFEPLWANDENTGSKYLIRLYHDVNNWIIFYWEHTLSQWLCTFHFNGVSFHTAISGLTWSAGNSLKLAFHWLAAGELGKTTAQGQIFAKVGSDAWQEAVPVEFTQVLQELAESILYVGSWGDVGIIDEHNVADGYIRYLHCFPEALPFEEIQALLGEPA